MGVREFPQHVGEQPPPHLQEVVALVEDDGDRPRRTQGFEQGAAVAVQPTQGRQFISLFVGLRIRVEHS